MPVRVTCLQCGKQFSAWDDLIGKTVQCPKCSSVTTVPGSKAGAAQPARGQTSSSASAAKPPGGVVKPAAFDGDRAASPSRTVKVAARGRPAVSRPADSRPTDSPPTVPRPPVQVLPSGSESSGKAVQPGAAEDSRALPCPNCRAPMPPDDDLCDACGYHLILRKVLDTRGVNQADRSTGFERFVQGQLAEGATLESVLFWAQLVAGFWLVFFSILCFGRWGLLLAAGGMLGFFFLRRVWSQGARAGSVGLPRSLGRWLESVGLSVERAAGWRLPEWPFPKARALSLNHTTFSDDDLADLEELDQFEVMDLEGTQVSDAGLAHLEPLKQLRFLVLRKTQVTPGGAADLRRSLPRTWIWC